MKKTIRQHPEKNWTKKPSLKDKWLVLCVLLLTVQLGFSNTNHSGNNNLTENPPIEKHRMWINLSSEAAGFSQFLLGYLTNATNGFDFGIDSKLFGWNGSAL